MRYPYRKDNGQFGQAIVENLPNVDLVFVSDSQDTQAIEDYVPNSQEYDSFFVIVGDGEYVAVWGMVGIVPYLYKSLKRIV